MFKPQTLLKTAMVVAVFFICISTAAAQQAPAAASGQSYDVVLQVLVGSDTPQSADFPKELAAVTRDLRARYQHAGYRIANTFLGRVAENGNLEYKSVTNLVRKETAESPTFLDWSLARLSSPDEGKVLHADAFRFGARIPLHLGGPGTTLSYETIGLNVNRLAIAPRTPTLLGTLDLPDTAGTMFLVVTVKPTYL
jgi:hypothetical protein